MAKYNINIYQDGASLVVQPDITANTPPQYYPLANIRSVEAKYDANYGATFDYKFAALCQVTIRFIDHSWQPVQFDIQEVANQAGWTPATEVGLNIATADINSWIGASSGGGSSLPGSLTVTDNDALGGDGTYFIDVASGAITGQAYKYLVVNDGSGATFSVLNDSAANNMLTTQGYSGKTVEKGMIIRAASGEFIQDITVTAGSVIGVK